VGQQRDLGCQLHHLEEVQDLGNVAAGIDHRSAARLLAPENRAVLLEAGDGQDLEFHAGSKPRRARHGKSTTMPLTLSGRR
jgi:hypothetical protein